MSDLSDKHHQDITSPHEKEEAVNDTTATNSSNDPPPATTHAEAAIQPSLAADPEQETDVDPTATPKASSPVKHENVAAATTEEDADVVPTEPVAKTEKAEIQETKEETQLDPAQTDEQKQQSALSAGAKPFKPLTQLRDMRGASDATRKTPPPSYVVDATKKMSPPSAPPGGSSTPPPKPRSHSQPVGGPAARAPFSQNQLHPQLVAVGVQPQNQQPLATTDQHQLLQSSMDGQGDGSLSSSNSGNFNGSGKQKKKTIVEMEGPPEYDYHQQQQQQQTAGPTQRRVMRPVPVTATANTTAAAPAAQLPKRYRLNPYATDETTFEAVYSPTTTPGSSTIGVTSGAGNTMNSTSTGDASLVAAFASGNEPGPHVTSGGRSPSKSLSLNSSPSLRPKDPSPASMLVSPVQFPAAPASSPSGIYGQNLPPSATWDNTLPSAATAQLGHTDTHAVRSRSQDSSIGSGTPRTHSHGVTPTNTAASSAMTPPPQTQGCYYSAPPPTHQGAKTPPVHSMDRISRTNSGPAGTSSQYQQQPYNGSFGQMGVSFGSNPSVSVGGTPLHRNRTVSTNSAPAQQHLQQYRQQQQVLSPTVALPPTLASIDLGEEEEGEVREAMMTSVTPPTSKNVSPSLGPKPSPSLGPLTPPPSPQPAMAKETETWRPRSANHPAAVTTIPKSKSEQRRQYEERQEADRKLQAALAQGPSARTYTDVARSLPSPTNATLPSDGVGTSPSSEDNRDEHINSKKRGASPEQNPPKRNGPESLENVRVKPDLTPIVAVAEPGSNASSPAPATAGGGRSSSPLGVPKGTLHRSLAGKVNFYPLPTEEQLERISQDPEFQPTQEKHQMARVFLGQLPYTVSEHQLTWIAYHLAGGVKMFHCEQITKNCRNFDNKSFDNHPSGKVPTGCFHAYVEHDDVGKLLVGLHKKVLMDDTGMWVATFSGAVGENMHPTFPPPTTAASSPQPALRLGKKGRNPTDSFPSLGEVHGQGGLTEQQNEDAAGLATLTCLRERCMAMRADRTLRIPHRPYGAVVAQLATSTYDPLTFQRDKEEGHVQHQRHEPPHSHAYHNGGGRGGGGRGGGGRGGGGRGAGIGYRGGVRPLAAIADNGTHRQHEVPRRSQDAVNGDTKMAAPAPRAHNNHSANPEHAKRPPAVRSQNTGSWTTGGAPSDGAKAGNGPNKK